MRTLLVALFCGLIFTANAQTTQKIGYAESDYILSQLPEFKKIESELKTHGAQLENQMKAKYDDYQAKLKAYQGMPATTPDAIKADKERELAALQENMQKFQQDANSSFQKKQADLMDPIYKKIGKAIEGRFSFNVKSCHTWTSRYVRYGTLLAHPHFSNNFDEICGPPPHRRILRVPQM